MITRDHSVIRNTIPAQNNAICAIELNVFQHKININSNVDIVIKDAKIKCASLCTKQDFVDENLITYKIIYFKCNQ